MNPLLPSLYLQFADLHCSNRVYLPLGRIDAEIPPSVNIGSDNADGGAEVAPRAELGWADGDGDGEIGWATVNLG